MPSPALQNAAAIATIVIAVATIIYVIATVAMLLVLTKTANYAKGQLESAERSRQLSLLRDLSSQWSSPLLREARELIHKQTGGEGSFGWTKPEEAPNLTDYFKVIALANFFEDMGLLEKEGQLTLDQVEDRFSTSLVHYQKTLGRFIEEQQKEDPSVLSNFTMLAEKMTQKLSVRS